jgi:hypothetical protein
MVTSANATNIVSRGITRSIFRWVHIICGIPILGYIYDSPSDTHNTPPVLGMSFFLYCSFRGFGCGKAMSFGDLFRRDRPNKTLQRNYSHKSGTTIGGIKIQ